jgi:hypothetical protein
MTHIKTDVLFMIIAGLICNGINLNVNINIQMKSESSLILAVHIYKPFIIVLTPVDSGHSGKMYPKKSCVLHRCVKNTIAKRSDNCLVF